MQDDVPEPAISLTRAWNLLKGPSHDSLVAPGSTKKPKYLAVGKILKSFQSVRCLQSQSLMVSSKVPVSLPAVGMMMHFFVWSPSEHLVEVGEDRDRSE